MRTIHGKLGSGASRAALVLLMLPGFVTTAGTPGVAGATRSAAASTPARFTLPAGTILYLRLKTPVSTASSHLHQAVAAAVVRQVNGATDVAIPLGAVAQGRIEKLIPSSSPTDRARLRLSFTELELPGEKGRSMAGHVKAVGNARETVLADGTVQGVLASELPVSRVNDGLAKLGKTHPELGAEMEKVAGKNLGQASTAIAYPAGTDFQFVLDKPLQLSATFPPAAATELPADLAGAVSQLLSSNAPQRAASKNGTPGDPLNLVVIGTEAQIRQTFQQAGWNEAEEKNSKSIWNTVRAVMDDQGFGKAPVSDLYLYGRPEDLAFEKTLNTFTKRHHLRLWRTDLATPDGRPVWLGAATHDVGFDVHPGVASHATDPDLDDERAKVGADLLVTGEVAAEQLVTRPDPLTEGQTATGGAWHTDGRLLAIELKSGASEAGLPQP